MMTEQQPYKPNSRDWMVGFLLGCGVPDSRAAEYAGKLLASDFFESVRDEEREKTIDEAQDELVRQDAFTERSLRILDDLRKQRKGSS